MIWLMGADEIKPEDIPQGAFVIYQGHHGDQGAQYADVVLPGAAYTEKSGTYVNTEGRVQLTRAATGLPGVAREDWKIIRAASEFLGATLPYDSLAALRYRMEEISPALTRYDVVEPASLSAIGKTQMVEANKGSKPTNQPLTKVIENFYFTDAISRSSATMGRCSAAKLQKASGEAEPNTAYVASG
jgi:NADH dehydrogenase (ubiquinone) Fe-S protein 1